MNRAIGVVVLATILLAMAAVSHAAEGDRHLEGRWQIVRMFRDGKRVPKPADIKMLMMFRSSDHHWELTVSTPKGKMTEGGNWKLNGSALTTVSKTGRVETMRVSVIGKRALELKKVNERLVLKRL